MALARSSAPSSTRWRRVARIAAGLAIAAIFLLADPSAASAHPLGNFTTNTSAAIRIRPDEVLVDYVIDLAEIPTLQARPAIDSNGDDTLQGAERSKYAARTCAEAAQRLEVRVGRMAGPLDVATTHLTLPRGQAGLRTLRLECRLRRPRSGVEERATIGFTDENYGDKMGWREVIAVGDGTTIIDTDVARRSISDRLTDYPNDRLSSPPRDLEASVVVVPGGPTATFDEPGSPLGGASAERFTSLVSERELTIPFGAFALGVSFVLGAVHAMAPGHGKTVMAAYLVGEQGTRRQALLLGATVALTHTGGVFALALVVSNSSVAPEALFPYLGAASGLLVVAIGVVLLRRAVHFRRMLAAGAVGVGHHHHHGIGHTHTHDQPSHDHGHLHHHHDPHDHDNHAHDHDNHAHDHDQDHGSTATTAGRPPVGARNMMAMGFAGGLVPSPSALVVLLGSIAIGRAWFGFVLIVAYGAGLAAVLVGAGLVIERLRHRVQPLLARRSRSRWAGLAVNLPMVTSTLVVVGGAYLVARALSAA